MISLSKIWRDINIVPRYGLLAGSLIVFGFIAFTFFSGKLDFIFLGEEYFVLSNAAVYDHMTAWIKYFSVNGRLFEGIYWTYLYKLIGFEPGLLRTFSFILLWFGSLLSAVAVSRIWPVKNRGLASLLVLLLSFFSFFATNWATHFSGDNQRIAVIFFWISVLSFQTYSRSPSWSSPWLWAAIFSHLASMLTYESTILLFPVAIILSTPIAWGELTKKRFTEYVLISLISLLLMAIVMAFYVVGNRLFGLFYLHYVGGSAAGGGFNLISLIRNFSSALANFSSSGVVNFQIFGQLFFCCLFIFPALWLHRKFFKGRDRGGKSHRTYFALYLAALWLLIFGLIPYNALNVGSLRIYATSAIGLVFLLLLLFQLAPRAIRPIAVVLIAAWCLAGVLEFDAKQKVTIESEAKLVSMFNAIYELVPSVKPNTWFVLVDMGFPNWGCGPGFSMLYLVPDLTCAKLSSSDPYFIADRYSRDINVRNTGGWIRNENIIILRLDENGQVHLVPQLTPSDEIVINWISRTPISTDYHRLSAERTSPSPMALYLQTRR